VKGDWRRILRNEQLYDLYCPPNVTGVWKYRAGACGMYDCKRETGTGLWCRNVNERGHLEDLRIDGSVILKYIVEETRMDSLECLL